MSAKPRNPYLVPALAAGLVLGAASATLLVVAVDGGRDAAAPARLDPALVQQVLELQAERDWAATVCGALTTWRGEIGAAYDLAFDNLDVTDPGRSWDAATTAFGDARDATTTMVEAIRAAETPDTKHGRALSDGVDNLVDHARDHIEEIGLRVAAIGGDVGILDGLNVPSVVDEVRSLIDDMHTDIEALREPASHMLDVMRANGDCTPFLRILQLD